MNARGNAGCVALALCAFLPLLASPAFAGPASNFTDIRQVVAAGTLRVGLVAAEIPPLLVTGPDGRPAGIEVAMAVGLASRLGVEPAFVRTAATHDELVAQVAAGSVDIAISSISRTSARALSVRFTRPYLTQSMAVLLNRKRAVRESVSCPKAPADVAALAAKPRTVGVRRGSVYELSLRGLAEKPALELFEDGQKFIADVEAGKLLAGLDGEVAARQLLAARPATRINVKLCLVGRQKDHIAIAVRPDAPNLVNWIDAVMDNTGFVLDPRGIFELAADWRF